MQNSGDEERPPIRVPKASFAPLREIIGLSDKTFEKLYRALLELKPQSTQERIVDQIEEKVSAIERTTIRSITREITELAEVCAKTELSVEQVATMVSMAVKDDPSKELELPNEAVVTLKERLVKLLEAPHALSVTSKSNDLLTEHQHFFYSARLFSDIRPVFSGDAKTVDAAVIMHNLVIHYGDSENHNDFHVALDDADIQVLKDLLNRAEEKSVTLQKMVKAAGVNFLPTND